MRNRPGILIANPDRGIQRLLRRALGSTGYSVTSADSAASTITHVARTQPDLIVLSAEFEDLRGSELVTQARAVTSAPIIALFYPNGTSSAGDLLDRGADDCVEEPFLVQELAARVRRLLIRAGVWLHPHAVTTAGGILEIDLLAQTACLGDRRLNLTSRQFDLLLVLLNAGGLPVPHNEVLRRVWGGRCGNGQQNLRRLVGGLRAQIERDPKRPALLISVRSIGYKVQVFGNPNASVDVYGRL